MATRIHKTGVTLCDCDTCRTWERVFDAAEADGLPPFKAMEEANIHVMADMIVDKMLGKDKGSSCSFSENDASVETEEMAVREMERQNREKFDLTIGQLDRVLSVLIGLTEESDPIPGLDGNDVQTVKHHAEDMIGAGEKILANLNKMGVAGCATKMEPTDCNVSVTSSNQPVVDDMLRRFVAAETAYKTMGFDGMEHAVNVIKQMKMWLNMPNEQLGDHVRSLFHGLDKKRS